MAAVGSKNLIDFLSSQKKSAPEVQEAYWKDAAIYEKNGQYRALETSGCFCSCLSRLGLLLRGYSQADSSALVKTFNASMTEEALKPRDLETLHSIQRALENIDLPPGKPDALGAQHVAVPLGQVVRKVQDIVKAKEDAVQQRAKAKIKQAQRPWLFRVIVRWWNS